MTSGGRRTIIVLVALLLLLLVGAAAALFVGAAETSAVIISEIRAPRIVLTLLIGAGLGVSGALLQGSLRNPLADPGIIGVSASAALGAVVIVALGRRTAHLSPPSAPPSRGWRACGWSRGSRDPPAGAPRSSRWSSQVSR